LFKFNKKLRYYSNYILENYYYFIKLSKYNKINYDKLKKKKINYDTTKYCKLKKKKIYKNGFLTNNNNIKYFFNIKFKSNNVLNNVLSSSLNNILNIKKLIRLFFFLKKNKQQYKKKRIKKLNIFKKFYHLKLIKNKNLKKNLKRFLFKFIKSSLLNFYYFKQLNIKINKNYRLLRNEIRKLKTYNKKI
jgi:hypothetical protein